jgi:hypothetical protein
LKKGEFVMNDNQGKTKYIPIRQKINERKAEQRKQKAIGFSDLKADFKRSPMIFIGLGGTAFFTMLMGLFIGLAPRITEDGSFILFGGANGIGNVIMGLFFGLLYAAVFPILGEWGVYYWHKRASLRDEGNHIQAWIGYTMTAITGIFVVVTSIAAATVLASLLHTFEAFRAIPEWAQKWTVLVIPIALALHAGANIWYDHVSAWQEERREMERSLQTTTNESENRIMQARLAAKERAAIAAAEEYERAATDGARKAGTEIGKRAWEKDRLTMGGDADGDGIPNVMDSDFEQTQAPTKAALTMRPIPAPIQAKVPVLAGGRAFGDNGNSDPMKG